MSEKIIFSMSGVNKVVPPNKVILNDISLSFFYGAKIGVIGINGSGKSSLLKIIAGEEKDFDGELSVEKKIKFGFLSQEPQLDHNLNVLDNIRKGMKDTVDLLQKFEELSSKMGEELPDSEMNQVIEKFGEVQEKLEATNGWEMERKLEIAMDALRVPPGDSEVSTLSGGERRRISLCRLILENPDVLILDEPTNHLDAESVAWLENHLKNFKGTVITVTHDRYFLDHVTEWILEMDRGNGYPYKGNYSQWISQKLERLDQEKKSQTGRKKTLKRELEWIRTNTKGRRSKNKARISAYENLLQVDEKQRVDNFEISIPIPQRLGEKVIHLNQVSKGYEDKLLIDNFSAIIPRGAIVGIIGPNGSGKTTLFNLISEQEKIDSGMVELGSTVKLSYVGQFRDSLEDDKNIWEAISEGEEEINLGFRSIHSRAYVSSFGFKGPEQQKRVGNLSGGERNRVHLAKLLKSGGNVLLLDEPTNDLDIETLRALEDALLNFAGCILVISHDRYFLDRIATHLIAFEGDSKVTFFEGNFTEYEEHRMSTEGEEALRPKKIRYKKIS